MSASQVYRSLGTAVCWVAAAARGPYSAPASPSCHPPCTQLPGGAQVCGGQGLVLGEDPVLDFRLAVLALTKLCTGSLSPKAQAQTGGTC